MKKTIREAELAHSLFDILAAPDQLVGNFRNGAAGLQLSSQPAIVFFIPRQPQFELQGLLANLLWATAQKARGVLERIPQRDAPSQVADCCLRPGLSGFEVRQILAVTHFSPPAGVAPRRAAGRSVLSLTFAGGESPYPARPTTLSEASVVSSCSLV